MKESKKISLDREDLTNEELSKMIGSYAQHGCLCHACTNGTWGNGCSCSDSDMSGE